MAKTISRDELKEMMARGEPFYLVEALPLHVYRQGHIPGALRLAEDEVDERASLFLPDRNAEIIVYSESSHCPAADNVANRLEALGYTNVKIYRGGKEDWVESGGQLQSGDPEFSWATPPKPVSGQV